MPTDLVEAFSSEALLGHIQQMRYLLLYFLGVFENSSPIKLTEHLDMTREELRNSRIYAE